jgi:regulatory associated protein of mTOR
MPHVSDHRAMCCFIIAMFCKGFHQGQVVSLSVELLESCIYHMDNMEKPLLRQWACLCTSNLWEDYPDAKWAGIRSSLHQKLCELVVDPVPEVRAAMLHALTTFLGIPDLTDQVAHIEASIAANVMIVTNDGNIIVRKELLVFFSTFIARYLNKFMVAAYEQLLEERESLQHPSSEDQSDEFNEPFMVKSRSRGINGNVQDSRSTIAQNTIFSNIWKQVLILSVDPQPEIARDASIIVDYVFQAMLYSPLAPLVQPVMKAISQHRQKKSSIRGAQEPIRTQTSNPQQSPPPAQPKHEGTLALGVMRRTASVAASLKNLAFGNPAPSQDAKTVPPAKSATLGRVPSSAGKGVPPRSNIPNEWKRPPGENDYHSPAALYQPAKIPLPRGFKARDRSQPPSIPLSSKFLQWSTEYFREPQMQTDVTEEPGSKEYNERLWRRNRNDRVIAQTQPQKEFAGNCNWNRPAGLLNNGTQPMKMCLHQFEPHLVAADDRDIIW